MKATPSWASLPCDVVEAVVVHLGQTGRVAASGVCKGWRVVAERPGMWRRVEFSTHRDGTRRSELRRLLSLAAWAQRHAAATESLVISARVPPDCQPAALKAVSQVALAAAGTLRTLSLTTNRGFWAGAWLPRLSQLRELALCSMEGGLSLHGDLSPLVQLSSLRLEAKQAVALQEHVRLPPGIQAVELGCIRDTLPPQLSQLTQLRSLAIRRGVVSEGILLTEYDCLAQLTGLTSLCIEHQEEEAWLPPPELLQLTRLRHLSICGNDCSRWPLHGSDESFDLIIGRMALLTTLDMSGCGLEQLPRSLLMPAGLDSGELGSSGGGSSIDGPQEAGQAEQQQAMVREQLEGQGESCRRRRLRRLLAHGNQLEASDEGEGEEPGEGQLVFPRTVRQLSIDWQVLQLLQPQHPLGAAVDPASRPALVLPPTCHQLALLGREGIDAALLLALPLLLPELRHVLLEPEALDALTAQQSRGSGGGSGSGQATIVRGDWQLVGGRWRPMRLPGQPAQQAQRQRDVRRLLQEAGVEVMELQDPSQLRPLLDQLAALHGR